MVMVGMEYLVGNAFAYYTKTTGKRILSIDKLEEYQKSIKKYWNKKGINATFVGSFKQVSEEYFEWFLLLDSDKVMIFNPGKTVTDLNNRFWGYLPFQVINSFVENENIEKLDK